MILTLISSDLAQIEGALAAGVDRIMIDLEQETKVLRQRGRELFLSDHTRLDAVRVREAFPAVQLTIRINSMNPDSGNEVREILRARPDRIMLPYFSSRSEVDRFLDLVDGASKPVLLFENRASLRMLEEIGSLVEEVFVGLNDLGLDIGSTSLAETLLSPEFERCLGVLEGSPALWGFGGIGAFTDTRLPVNPEAFFLFQASVGSRTGWLSRSFRRVLDESPQKAAELVARIRTHHRAVRAWSPEQHRRFREAFRRDLLLGSRRPDRVEEGGAGAAPAGGAAR